jgi:FtsZ-interacting cell division protein YlmF
MRLPRPIKNSLLPLLLFFVAQKACAQFAAADDYFNGGAQLYISNNIPAALEKTEDGLKFYPDDAKLKKLEELLKQQQKSQSSQSQQNQQQQQSQSQQNANNQKNQQQNRQQQRHRRILKTKKVTGSKNLPPGIQTVKRKKMRTPKASLLPAR